MKKNGDEVSSGELLGAPGGGKGFENANLLTIPVSFPTEAFEPGDDISSQGARAQLLPRQPSADRCREAVVRRQLHESGRPRRESPTLYLVRGNDDDDEDCDHDAEIVAI